MPYRVRAAAPRSDAWWEYWGIDMDPVVPSITVDGPKEVDTGLVDHHGNTIMRVQAPIGFGRDEEHL